MGQIHGIAHLGVGNGPQVALAVRCFNNRNFFNALFARNAQAVIAEDEHKILTGQGIKTERNKNGIAVQIRYKVRTGPPCCIAVQAGQHVFHARQAVAVTVEVITRRQGGRYFAAGKVVAGNADAHGLYLRHMRPGRQFAAAVKGCAGLRWEVAQGLQVGK